MAAATAGILILNNEQVRILSKDVYLQEALAIQNIPFKSENERVKYLLDCKANHDTILNLLNSADALKQNFHSDDVKSQIAHDIVECINICCNLALQTVRNYTLRMEYLKKIKVLSDTLLRDLRSLPGGSDVDVAAELAQRATNNRNAALELARNHQSPASRAFSKSLKETGLSFHELIDKYKNEYPEYRGKTFDELEDSQKFEIYEKIIESSGRGNIIATNLVKALGAAGIVTLLFAAGMMVWDIFSSAHPIQTAVRDSVTTAASVGGAALGEIVGVTVAGMAGIDAVFATIVGVVTGFVGAFVVGAFVGWMLDFIFSSGGRRPSSIDGNIVHVATMPDGQAMARQIAHG